MGATLFDSEVADLLYRDRHSNETFECDWLSGCFLFVRREAYQQLGGLDQGFAKYFEDVDFCARMHAKGWSVLFNGSTYGYHIEQRDSQNILSKDGWLMARSYVRWLLKWGLNPHRRIEGLREGERNAFEQGCGDELLHKEVLC